ncbi:hypothetical protein QFC22_000697 [Naganishia vaughanmartiniae]|uniref:Uncharacterized protein n=1 Tax=Naganishia vaughanmartiniae TaxID=1424756 RepID=A0ACC2XIX1_9TREE|nr:hypothetical protein QFC22_000697 [Naganishia vaughanmartiniae]
MADDNRKRSSSQDDKNRGGFVEFDYIPFEDIEWGETLGSGSFGCVYKGTYLGIDIALKEILPSNEYDVDLKGENLLITGNERIKITDFGFARIAARDEAEMKRMSYCGTDGYMSPEILLGFDFDERTDVFSLGVIFAEIISRTLVDAGNAFTRFPPFFTLEEDEVRERANEGCPPDWINLAIHCTASKPEDRPSMKEVLERLKRIEVDITSKLPLGRDEHIGSIKIISPPVKIPHHLRNLFSKGSTMESTTDSRHPHADQQEGEEVLDDDPEEDDVVEMLQGSTGRGHASREVTSWRTARWEEPREQKQSVMELFQSGPLPVEPSRHLPGGYPAGLALPLEPTAVDTSSVMTIRPLQAAEPQTTIGIEQNSSASPPAARRDNQLTDGAASVYHEALSTVLESRFDEAQSSAIGTSDPAAELGLSGNAPTTPTAILPVSIKAGSSADGVHRFTIVNQKALRKVEAVKAKKQSACTFSAGHICLLDGAD